MNKNKFSFGKNINNQNTNSDSYAMAMKALHKKVNKYFIIDRRIEHRKQYSCVKKHLIRIIA